MHAQSLRELADNRQYGSFGARKSTKAMGASVIPLHFRWPVVQSAVARVDRISA